MQQSINADNLQIASDWLKTIIDASLHAHFKQTQSVESRPLNLHPSDSGIARFIADHNPSYEEFVLVMMALMPHIQPQFFNKIIAEFLPEGGDFPEFGGVKGGNHRGILPTGETAQFILASDDLPNRLLIQQILNSEHWFSQQHLLSLQKVPGGEPLMSGRLVLEAELVEQLTLGSISKPRFSMDFPAQYLETDMDWNDVVLHSHTAQQIHEIETWISHNDTLLFDWGMKKSIKPGYRALFYGPPGTGKTLTATLLGKQTGKDVYRIDLSRVVSKYIGETEQNLAKLFDKAEHKNWILFFDEADALFGKRTEIRDSHDRYANQEISYLLQRIETFNGLVILASNQRMNIDEAFMRRFHAVIHFPMPRPDERYQLWIKAIPKQLAVAEDIIWQDIAHRYELSGANIINISHYCALECLAENTNRLQLKRLEMAVMREFTKEGKVV